MGRGAEGIEFFLGDAGLAGAVGFGAQAGDDVRDHGLEHGVIGGVGRQDAVAIELGVGKNFDGVGGIFNGDLGALGLAQIYQDLFGGSEEFLAFGMGIINRGQRQGRQRFEQVVGILE